jgi:DNA replication and repair protein RecF
MLITHLSLTNFRNFARLDVELPGGSILLVGDNAQGKTSLLEAIYFLTAFTSFQATNDKQLINFFAGEERLSVARIVGDFYMESDFGDLNVIRKGSHNIEVRLIKELNGNNGSGRLRKEVLLDGVKRKITEITGLIKAVLFLPQMLRMIEGVPEDRRKYLDLSISQVIPDYASLLGNYRRILSQRNALLKRLFERRGDPAELAYWDEQLSMFGAYLIYYRIHALKSLEQWASKYHDELTRGDEVLRLNYLPAYEPYQVNTSQFALPLNAQIDRSRITVEEIQQGMMAALGVLHETEIRRGVTTIGPHRDEIRFLSNGIDLGIYGSRGQARTAVLSLKLAEVSWIKEKSGILPILMLDEVLAELDTKRREDLLKHVLKTEQSLVTTTDLELFEKDFVQNVRMWEIRDGRILETGTPKAG